MLELLKGDLLQTLEQNCILRLFRGFPGPGLLDTVSRYKCKSDLCGSPTVASISLSLPAEVEQDLYLLSDQKILMINKKGKYIFMFHSVSPAQPA